MYFLENKAIWFVYKEAIRLCKNPLWATMQT